MHILLWCLKKLDINSKNDLGDAENSFKDTSEDRYDDNYFEKKPESAFIDASEDCPANNAPTDKLFLKFLITFPMILLKSTL